MRMLEGVVLVAMLLPGCGAAPASPSDSPALSLLSDSAPSATASVEASRVFAVAQPPTPKPRGRARGYPSVRPSQLRSAPMRAPTANFTPVDFEALPLAVDVPVRSDAAAFSLTRSDLTARACPPRTEAMPRVTWSIGLWTPSPLVLRIGNSTLPPTRFLDGRHVDGAMEALASKGTLPAAWSTLSTRSLRIAEIADAHGSFDPTTSRVLVQQTSKASAAALIDGVLYAYRRCTSHCDAPVGSPERDEELTLIGPPALWLGSSNDPSHQPLDRRTPFTVLSAPVHVGSASTLIIVALDGDLDRFKKGVAPLGVPQVFSEKHWTTFSLDVVWPEGSSTPSVSLFESHAGGADVAAIRSDVGNIFNEPVELSPFACVALPEPPPPPTAYPRPCDNCSFQ